MVFYNGSNYESHLIIKEQAKNFKEEFIYLGYSTEKYKTFSFPMIKEVKRIDKNGKQISKNIYYNYNLLIENVWQIHYRILLILLLKEFTKLNANMDIIIKNSKRMELNTKIVSALLDTKNVRDDLILSKS